MKPLPRRKASFFPRFLASFLIAGQLAYGLPAFADNLRAGQEAETHQAGVERELRAGTEEWPSQVTIRPMETFPPLEPDPDILRTKLTYPHAREFYTRAVTWLNEHQLQMPSAEELQEKFMQDYTGHIRVDRGTLALALQQVEKETAGSRIPILDLSREAKEDAAPFVAVYLATLQQPAGAQNTLWIPLDWQLGELQRAASRAKPWLDGMKADPLRSELVRRILEIPPPLKRFQEKDTLVIVEMKTSPTGEAEMLIAAHRQRRNQLKPGRERRAASNLFIPEVMEVTLPAGWDLLQLTKVTERQRPALEEAASKDPSFRGELEQIDRLTGSHPDPALTPTQARTVREYLRQVRHSSDGVQLPTAQQVADTLGDIKAVTVTAHLREVRALFGNQRRAEVFLPLKSKQEFFEMLREGVEAYNRDHRPEVGIPVDPGLLYQAYKVFQRVSWPERRAPVTWQKLAEETGKQVTPQEAKGRFEALDRLFRYLGLPLAEPWDPASDSVRLAEKPAPDPVPPTPEEILFQKLQPLLTQMAPKPDEWNDFLELAEEQARTDELIAATESLPGPVKELLRQAVLARQAAGTEQGAVDPIVERRLLEFDPDALPEFLALREQLRPLVHKDPKSKPGAIDRWFEPFLDRLTLWVFRYAGVGLHPGISVTLHIDVEPFGSRAEHLLWGRHGPVRAVLSPIKEIPRFAQVGRLEPGSYRVEMGYPAWTENPEEKELWWFDRALSAEARHVAENWTREMLSLSFSSSGDQMEAVERPQREATDDLGKVIDGIHARISEAITSEFDRVQFDISPISGVGLIDEETPPVAGPKKMFNAHGLGTLISEAAERRVDHWIAQDSRMEPWRKLLLLRVSQLNTLTDLNQERYQTVVSDAEFQSRLKAVGSTREGLVRDLRPDWPYNGSLVAFGAEIAAIEKPEVLYEKLIDQLAKAERNASPGPMQVAIQGKIRAWRARVDAERAKILVAAGMEDDSGDEGENPYWLLQPENLLRLQKLRGMAEGLRVLAGWTQRSRDAGTVTFGRMVEDLFTTENDARGLLLKTGMTPGYIYQLLGKQDSPLTLSPREELLLPAGYLLLMYLSERYERRESMEAFDVLSGFQAYADGAAKKVDSGYGQWRGVGSQTLKAMLETAKFLSGIPADPLSAGMEEQRGAARSAAREEQRVVIGPSVAARFAGLEGLPGIEGRVVVDRGPDTVMKLMEAGVEAVQYYGSAREGRQFQAMTAGLFLADIRSAGEPEFLTQLEKSFLLAGVPRGMIAAGIEALAAGAEELRQAA